MKLFTSILNARLLRWNHEHNFLSDLQAAYRPRLGCLNHTFLLYSLVTKQLRANKRLYCFFVDLSGAFDSVSHMILWEKLSKAGLSSAFVKCIKCLYERAHACVKTIDGFTDPLNINVGVLQGESLSPTLFNFFINDVIETLNRSFTSPVSIGDRRLHALLYADDIVLMAYSAESLQQKIDVLKSYFKQNQLILNVFKSKIVVFRNSGRLRKNDKFKWGVRELEIVKEFKYLGVLYPSTGAMYRTVKDFLARGRAVLSSMWPIFIKSKLPLSQSQFKLFNSLVKTVIGYGAEVWGLRHLHNIDNFQWFFVKKLLKLPQSTPNFFIKLESNLENPSVNIITQSIKLWAKSLNPQNHLLNSCYCDQWNLQGDVSNNWALQLKNVLNLVT
ncbi:unnamed protein product [Allacma fusca]|uniref:Reverse transcriptase domain-containing protein n=1 Tax=Allacma fusca TaxID=39272 RepID=A0A8J2KVZ0_9HEXA|nr:unnamed protein product [Allacma fusca]